MNAYNTPELEIIAFGAEDIITTSEPDLGPSTEKTVSLRFDEF